MSPLRSHLTLRHAGRALLALALLSSTGFLAGCGTRDGMSTGSIPDDYRTRHPITLTEVEHALDLPISAVEAQMTVGMSDAVGGFAAEYLSKSTSTVQIMLPQGSPNAAAAHNLSKQIRSKLISSGIASSKIVHTSYQAGGQGDAAPIRLSYIAMTAVTNQCGQWPADLANTGIENRNWENFGCATQANLAAQIANPMDLLTPRQPAPIDASRRSVVISTYREGKNTATSD